MRQVSGVAILVDIYGVAAVDEIMPQVFRRLDLPLLLWTLRTVFLMTLSYGLMWRMQASVDARRRHPAEVTDAQSGTSHTIAAWRHTVFFVLAFPLLTELLNLGLLRAEFDVIHGGSPAELALAGRALDALQGSWPSFELRLRHVMIRTSLFCTVWFVALFDCCQWTLRFRHADLGDDLVRVRIASLE